MCDFEKLERLNCQVDIWIDEEEYEQVFAAMETNPLWHQRLITAFEHSTCTFVKDQEWFDLLNDSDVLPITTVKINDNEKAKLNDKRDWSFFFGAKLIRAKIQQKGTDCYFQRLDDIIPYLERNLPTIRKENANKDVSTRLAVIYLLEMAAAGVGADQISFSDRARRILRNLINNSDEDFIKFYDLISRSNIGVGYFHEAQYRKAVLEFNHIIRSFKGNVDAIDQIHERKFFDRSEECCGKLLLYLPSILYRAQVQLKLQLAYHSLKTTSFFQSEFSNAGGYRQSRIALIKAEAYQQMGNLDRSLDELREVINYLLSKSSNPLMNSGQLCFKILSDRLKDISCLQYSNLRGRLIDLVISSQLTQLEVSGNIRALNDPESPYELFQLYHDSAKDRRSVRGGYLQQVAKFINILVDSGQIKLASTVYDTNRDGILEDERTEKNCSCKEKGIDLRRLRSEHFEEFTDCMKGYFEKIKGEYSQDKKIFFERLYWLEEHVRENLNWRKKDLDSMYNDSIPCNWCATCLAFKPSSFGGLLECGGQQTMNNAISLCDNDYEWIMNHWDNHFLNHLKKSSIQVPANKALHFLGLQRWNSTSPAQGRSLGGGYLIYHTDIRGMVDLGIAIDPGFDFVRNLFHVGFSLADIDIVLLSHAHLDHIRDYESMITLCLELYNRDLKNKIKYKLHTIMTLGVYRRLEHIIESPGLRDFIEPYIIDIDKEILENYLIDNEYFFKLNPSNKSVDKKILGIKEKNRVESLLRYAPAEEGLYLMIQPTNAYHNDYSEYSDSFGFIIKIIENDNIISSNQHPLTYSIGYTGDTRWDENVIMQYKQCDSIITHLGSLIDRKKESRKKFNYYSSPETCFNFLKDKNHPYLVGMLHFLTELKAKYEKKGGKPLVLMSEFGEEMRGRIRLDFIKRLKDAYGNDFDILPVDVGLDVLLNDNDGDNLGPQVLCVQCNDFIKLSQTNFETYGHDEALFCVCETCRKSTPQNVLQDNLRRLYEEGRNLRTLT